MATCALSAQHAENGALFSDELSPADCTTFALDYLAEAIRLVPADFTSHTELDLIRSYGFLALLGTQTGNTDLVHRYLGLYLGLSGCKAFNDESRWPPGLSVCKVEVRRRLF